MQDTATINLLIDKARAIAGSDGKVAKALKVPATMVSDWRHGRRNPTPEDFALLAMVAQVDPLSELARATVQKHQGTAKGDMLMKALGKALLATGAVIGSAGASARPIGSMIRVAVEQTIQCIKRIQQELCQPLLAPKV